MVAARGELAARVVVATSMSSTWARAEGVGGRGTGLELGVMVRG